MPIPWMGKVRHSKASCLPKVTSMYKAYYSKLHSMCLTEMASKS